MKWEMEVDEIEAVLEKIWDLHDKLSDAIHSISRAHFLNSIKNLTRKSDEFYFHRKKKSADDDAVNKGGSGFVFAKEFRVDEDEPAVQEAKSLYAIRTALENLEDQLEFFHTVQTQQRAERDAAVARLEQSRIILAMRLAEHQGKKYKVIEEAQALVGDVRDASRFVAPEHLRGSTPSPSGESFVPLKGKSPNALLNFFLSSFSFVSKSLKENHTVGILGNAALLAISMLAFAHLNQSGSKEKYTLDVPGMHDASIFGRDNRKVSHTHGLFSGSCSTHLDVMLARG
ncbi:plastid division protein PDV1 [Sesamum indicum]|uniref:Plastid division protein PDV1 n=1 Tax=Sesamum indicum TaxID=4182 RepID=A0A6I9TGI3_SESIN|nr:plastid division protein PDV1 [Sesamum indicum]